MPPPTSQGAQLCIRGPPHSCCTLPCCSAISILSTPYKCTLNDISVVMVNPWVMTGSSSAVRPFQQSSSTQRQPDNSTWRYISTEEFPASCPAAKTRRVTGSASCEAPGTSPTKNGSKEFPALLRGEPRDNQAHQNTGKPRRMSQSVRDGPALVS